MRLDGAVALVTGASSGIGAATAGLILLGVSYALYRSLATEETASRT